MSSQALALPWEPRSGAKGWGTTSTVCLPPERRNVPAPQGRGLRPRRGGRAVERLTGTKCPQGVSAGRAQAMEAAITGNRCNMRGPDRHP